MSGEIVLTIGRSAPARSSGIYLDFQHYEVSRGRGRVHLWPHAFLMAAAILAAPGPLSTEDLIAFSYDGRRDGGPDWARGVVRVALWHARQRLKPLGIGFHCRPRLGYEAVIQ